VSVERLTCTLKRQLREYSTKRLQARDHYWGGAHLQSCCRCRCGDGCCAADAPRATHSPCAGHCMPANRGHGWVCLTDAGHLPHRHLASGCPALTGSCNMQLWSFSSKACFFTAVHKHLTTTRAQLLHYQPRRWRRFPQWHISIDTAQRPYPAHLCCRCCTAPLLVCWASASRLAGRRHSTCRSSAGSSVCAPRCTGSPMQRPAPSCADECDLSQQCISAVQATGLANHLPSVNTTTQHVKPSCATAWQSYLPSVSF
jgi:hypothetical protein